MNEVHCSSNQESQWIDKARAGDLPAFNQLVLTHQDAAFRIAKWMVNDAASAEDIVQTVFLAAYCQISRFRGNCFRAWLHRMIHNACIDELRRRKRLPCLSMEPQDVDCEPVQIAQWLIDSRQTPEETLLKQEAWDRIDKCLCELPEPMREVVVLIDIEGVDYAEAASTLGIPLGTIKSRLGRARARLRDHLSEAQLVAAV